MAYIKKRRYSKAEEVQLLTDITNSIISSLDMREIFHVIATKIRRLVDFYRASIVLIDEARDQVQAFVLVTIADSNYREGVYPLKGTAQEWVLKHRKSCIDSDLKEQRFRENQGLYAEGLRSSLRVPLFLRGKVIGTLNLDCRRTGAYTKTEQRLLEQVAGQIAIAVENSRLYDEALRRAQQIAAINSSLERTVEEKTVKIRELEQKRAILTGLIAHNLKNPIIGIRRALQMLAIENGRFAPGTLKSLLDELCSSCDLLLGIVNDMLDVYRYEFASYPLYLEPVNISDPLNEGLRLLRYQIAEKAVNVVTRTGNKLIVNGDGKRLGRVFLNLLENAVKFSQPGASITITTSFTMEDASPYAKVTIEDEGPGIPEQDLTRIFDQFYQVERKALPVEGGTGLGLYYCKMVVEAHGGAIWAENRPNGGAVFSVLLPSIDDANYLFDGHTKHQCVDTS